MRSKNPTAISWPHAPLHRICEAGTYMVTAGTYLRQPLFVEGPRLRMLHNALLAIAVDWGWQLEAWAVFPNHYHFVGYATEPDRLEPFLQTLHARTAIALNAHDRTPNRRVWHNYWDTRLTFERSYLARLQYVHQNPVRHGLVRHATAYSYGSAAWFERNATPAQIQTLAAFKIDRVNVPDDF